MIAIGLMLAAVAGVAALYGIKGRGSNGEMASGAVCRPAAAIAARLQPLVTGEIAAVKVNAAPAPLAPVSFAAPDGKALTLADFRGRVVLLNLWATWCAPCRAEMPALDRLQAELGSPGFEVVAVNIDTQRLERPKQFLKDVGVTALAYYADKEATIFTALKRAGKAFGMPTTLLIDGNGCELAALAGPAEWSSPEAKAFIRAALAK